MTNNIISLLFSTGWCPFILDIIDCPNITFSVGNVYRFIYSYLEPLCLSEMIDTRDVSKLKRAYMPRYKFQHVISLTFVNNNKSTPMLNFLVNSPLYDPQLLVFVGYFLDTIDQLKLDDLKLASGDRNSAYFNIYSMCMYAEDMVDINQSIDTKRVEGQFNYEMDFSFFY